MFDTKLIATRIKDLRILRNMTQMNLADELGVSYQAVSNWERGNSMPDISKLEDLANILDCSINELLGSSKETVVVNKFLNEDMDHLTEIIDIEELSQVIPILPPKQARSIMENILISNEDIKLNEIITLAPFLTQDYLTELLDGIDLIDNLEDIIGLAPFLSETAINKAVDKIVAIDSMSEIVGFAPFLNKGKLDSLVMNALENDKIDECTGLYPFLSKDTLLKVADTIVKKHGVSALASIAPFIC